jgi:hypothetical protein
VKDRWQNDSRVLLRNYEFLSHGQKRMEESEMACFCGRVHTRMSKLVSRETVYMSYSAAPGLIAVNVKVGVAYIGCRDVCDEMMLEALRAEARRIETLNMVKTMHENRRGVGDIVAMMSAAAEQCAVYLTEGDNYLCYRMRRRLNNLGVPWICRQDWGRFGNWDLREQEPRYEDMPAYVAELREVQAGFAAGNSDGVGNFQPWYSWYWRWQADQISMGDGGYHQTRGHFVKMWVDLAPYERNGWGDDPDEDFRYLPGLIRYDSNKVYREMGGPDVMMLPRWLVGENGVAVDQFDGVFEALQSSWEAGRGGRDMAEWPFAGANDEPLEDYHL